MTARMAAFCAGVAATGVIVSCRSAGGGAPRRHAAVTMARAMAMPIRVGRMSYDD